MKSDEYSVDCKVMDYRDDQQDRQTEVEEGKKKEKEGCCSPKVA